MQLDPIEAGLLRVPGRQRETGDGLLDILFAHFSRRRVRTLSAIELQLRSARLYCRWSHMAGVMDVALGLGTAMHELRDERRAGFVNRLHDGFPAVPVRVGGEPGWLK